MQPQRKPGAVLAAMLVAAALGAPAAVAADIAQSDLDGSLIRAANRGDWVSFNLVLKLGANVHAVDARSGNAVLAAVEGDQPAVLKLLLHMGVSPEARGTSGFTPLTQAALRGSGTMLRMLLDAGADPDRRNAAGDTPLHLAVALGHAAALDELLWARPRLEIANALGETPLLTAIRVGNGRAFNALMARDADFNARDLARRNALLLAIVENRADMALALIEAGAAFDAMLGTYTTLRMARSMGHADVVAALERRGARAE